MLVTAWNTIQSILSGVWNVIKTVATTIFGGLQSFWQKHGEQITQALVNVWNGIKNVLTIIWNIISTIARIVFNNWGTPSSRRSRASGKSSKQYLALPSM